MTNAIKLAFTLSGPDLLAIARALATNPAFNRATPDEATVGDRTLKSRGDWRSKLEPEGPTVRVSWGDLMQTHFSYMPPQVVSARISDFPSTSEDVIALIAPLPFDVAAFGVLHNAWRESYTPPGFSGLHALLGWACAFRGAGHDRLVSRRWLDHGPWRLIRSDGDLSFVQFHDLAANADEALVQAKPGHARMGIGDTGGYLQDDYVYRAEVKGLYIAEERKLMIAAADKVSQVSMRDACAARRARRHDPKEPIERIGYMFISEALAREHLHELWLRELECWALVDGQKVRLDDHYAPVADRPAWVVRLDH